MPLRGRCHLPHDVNEQEGPSNTWPARRLPKPDGGNYDQLHYVLLKLSFTRRV